MRVRASSGLPVSLQADGACTVAQLMVSVTGAGTCMLTAQQAGNDAFTPAPDVVQQFEILNMRRPSPGARTGHPSRSLPMQSPLP